MRFMTLAAIGALFASQAHADATLDLVAPISDYKLYVSEQLDELVTDTEAFVSAIKGGDVEGARPQLTQMRFQKLIDPRGLVCNQPATIAGLLRERGLIGQMRGQAAQADERIANLVQDTAGKLAHQFDLLRVAQRLQHLLPFTEIGKNRHKILRRPV